MSKCVSSHGEYHEHETSELPFVCGWCFAFDESAAVARIAELEAEVGRLRHAHDLIRTVSASRLDVQWCVQSMVDAAKTADGSRVAELEAEVARLRALTEAQAERGAAQRQQLDAARALHSREEFEDSPGVFFCSRCQRTAGLWPCETVAVLDGGGDS